MKKVQTKLHVLGLAAVASLAIFAGLLIHGVYKDYVALSNFQQTTQISLTAYDLARNLTAERQMAYQASAFLGEGTPEQMIERFRVASEKTSQMTTRLGELSAGKEALFRSISGAACLRRSPGTFLSTRSVPSCSM
ncbi:MAG: hypothetical protein QM760_13730 [Nibricoccus sp.]